MKSCEACGHDNPDDEPACERCGEPLAPPLPSGTPLTERYTLGSCQHRGPLGYSYKGAFPAGRQVVFHKEFLPEECGRSGSRVAPMGKWHEPVFSTARARYEVIWEAVRSLEHRNIIPILDLVEANNTSYVVTAYLDAKDARKRVAAGSLDEDEAQQLLRQIGDAVTALHTTGLLHLDLKPENILLPDDAPPRLIDFDSARWLDEQRPEWLPTMLTPGFAAPEQHTEGNLTRATDVYGLAATLYYLLAGEPPTPADLRLEGNPLSALHDRSPEVSPTIARAVAQGLELEPEDRPQTVADFLGLLGGQTVTRPGVTAPSAAHRREAWQGDGWISAVAFSPCGNWLAAAGEDGVIRARELRKGDQRELHGHKGWVTGLAFSPTGTLFSSSDDRTVREWDLSGERELRRTDPGPRQISALAACPRTGRPACAAADGTLRMRPFMDGLPDPGELRGHEAPVAGLAFTLDGQLLASAGWDATIRLWDVSTRREVACLRGQGGPVCSVAFRPDGAFLASGGEGTSVCLWDLRDRQWREVAAPRGNGRPAAGLFEVPVVGEPRPLPGHQGRVRAVVFDPGGRRLASGGEDRTVRLYEAETGAPMAIYHGHEGPVACLAFSPAGTRLASGGWDGSVKLWEPAG